jgi:hypothetical protein
MKRTQAGLLVPTTQKRTSVAEVPAMITVGVIWASLEIPQRSSAHIATRITLMPLMTQAGAAQYSVHHFRLPHVISVQQRLKTQRTETNTNSAHKQKRETTYTAYDCTKTLLPATVKLFHHAKLIIPWRMVSSRMLRRVGLVRTDVSEELSASYIRVTSICD